MLPSWPALPREETQKRFTQALDSAAAEVFEMMVGTPSGSSDASHAAARRRLHRHDWAGRRPLRGVELPLQPESAAQIAGKMLGTDEDTSAECIRDALGEICNMVAGSFKAQVSDVADPMHALRAHRRERQGLPTVPARRRPAHPGVQEL